MSASYILRDLADRTNAENQCWPEVETIADDCEMSVRVVKAGLQLLEELQLISRERRYAGYQSRRSDLYTLHLDIAVTQPKEKAKPRGKAVSKSNDTITAGADSAPNEVATPSIGANSAPFDEGASGANPSSSGANSALASGANSAAEFAESAPALTEEHPVNPQSSSLPEVPQEHAAQFDGEVDEDLYLGLPRPEHDDDDDLGIDELTKRVLRGLDERIEPIVLVRRLRADGVDTARLNLIRASTEVWTRHKGKISDPIAYLTKAIEADCTNPDWAIARPGYGTRSPQPPAASGGAVTADKICEAQGEHSYVGTYKEICSRCGSERPDWRDDRDAQLDRDAALAAEGVATR